MKKIIIEKKNINTIDIEKINKNQPIFVIDNGKVKGMVVRDKQFCSGDEEDQGWILRTGGEYGAYGFYDTLEELVKEGWKRDYNFVVDLRLEDLCSQ